MMMQSPGEDFAISFILFIFLHFPDTEHVVIVLCYLLSSILNSHSENSNLSSLHQLFTSKIQVFYKKKDISMMKTHQRLLEKKNVLCILPNTGVSLESFWNTGHLFFTHIYLLTESQCYPHNTPTNNKMPSCPNEAHIFLPKFSSMNKK